jgi:putative adhesin
LISSKQRSGLVRRGSTMSGRDGRAKQARLPLPDLSPWGWLVAGSVAVLGAAGILLGALWLSSMKTTTAFTHLPGSVLGIELRVQSGDVTIVGGSQRGVSISHSDRSAFGHAARERRSLHDGIAQISSTCPQLVLGSCASDYRIDVPNNIPLSIRVENGAVHLTGYHGSADIATNTGAITVQGYCGFVLGAASASGDVSVSADCSPERLALRSDSGNVSVLVPAGSYRLQAASTSGSTTIKGVTNDDGAPWAIQALSNSGAVTVGTRS